MDILKEMRRLHALGWAIHWIRPNSKAPVDSGWTTGERKTIEALAKQYKVGMGVGVRLGKASKITGNRYLCNIDIDIKSSDSRHRKEAFAALEKVYPGLRTKAPTVKTGYGLRLFCATKKPVASGKIAQSKDQIKVYMPTAPINRRQELAVKQGLLTQKELEKGYRARPAWELELMSEGRQVVLPPSIHPETKERYEWLSDYDLSPFAIPFIEVLNVENVGGRPSGSTMLNKFTPVEDVSLDRLPVFIRKMITDGEGVQDRSADCYKVSIAMLKDDYTVEEIMTVLTDRDYYLGETGYDHRQTSSRKAAAAWVRDYCIKKAKKEYKDKKPFEAEIIEETLNDEEIEAQSEAIKKGRPWQDKLVRSGKDGGGAIKPILQNIITILTHAIAPDVFKYDEFSSQEYYGQTAPWENGTKGKPITDNDATALRVWLSKKWGFEPSGMMANDAITHLAHLNAYHPVRDQLEALPPWDGVGRIDTWLKKNFEAEGDDEYLAQVFRKWLLASITRTYEPGAKFDWMPILEGSQGIGKSRFGAVLFGDHFFGDNLPRFDDKDSALYLRGKRCVELAELSTFRKADVATAKAFVTRQSDKVRPPYGRKEITLHRQTVFFGTTNEDGYLKDQTGNRRFIPVKVGKLNFRALMRDKDQLWAEALYLYQWEPEPLYLEGDALAHSHTVQEEKMEMSDADAMADELLDFLEAEKEKKTPTVDLGKIQVKNLFDGITGPLKNWRMDGRHLQFAVTAFKIIERKKLGYTFSKRRVKGRSYWNIKMSR